MTEDGGTSWRRVPGTDTPDFHWVNDLELGINDSRVLFAATRTGVWRSTDWGQSWVALLGTHVRGGCLDLAISPTERDDVLFAAYGASTWTKASAAMPDSGVMSAIAVAPGAPDRVAAGTTKGDVLSTRQALAADSLTNWPASRPRDGWVTSVAFDSQNPDTVYATYGSFGGSHVYRSRDGGGTWQALDGSGDSVLPDIPVHSIAIDPDDSSRLYLGTDLGVLVSVDGGQRWMVEATGFGPVVTEWLSLIRDSSGRKRLFAFTHGRGVWRVDVR
jgi:hypothetical protein